MTVGMPIDIDAPHAGESTLAHDDAIQIAAALLDHLAVGRGIRSLLIKGDTLAHYGLREARVSSDVDVLVEPQRFDEFITIVESLGWTEFVETFQSRNFTVHSTTFLHDTWPITLDIHRHYPGFLRPVTHVFDILWGRRATAIFAHRHCQVPDRVSSALFLALHSLRSVSDQARHSEELESLRSADFTADEKAELGRLALDTGSAAPLADVLAALGVEVTIPEEEFQTPAYRAWTWKVAGAHGSYTHATAAEWLAMLARVPWGQKPRVLYRAVWPSRSDVIANNDLDEPSVGQIMRARAGRLSRGIRVLPGVVFRRTRVSTGR